MTSVQLKVTKPVGLRTAIDNWTVPAGYLAAAAMGLPTTETVAAQRADLDLWSSGGCDPAGYLGIMERTRGHYAALVGVSPERVAAGSQTSVITSLVAAAVPDGAEVLVVNGDFSSIIFPFLQRLPHGQNDRGIRVRTVPIDVLAESVTEQTWLVVFSHIQSSTGVVADVAAIIEAAARHGAYTFCDTTQSAGVHPVDASLFDFSVCHTYKWLCAPRGAAFLTVSQQFQRLMSPIQAGWCAGEDIWESCYGPEMTLAADARVFDVSPAFPSWVGAEPAIRLFSQLNISEVWHHATGLGNALCDELGIPQQHQAIVTMPDPGSAGLNRLVAAGISASGRAGRLRFAFHLWNTEADVAAVALALR